MINNLLLYTKLQIFYDLEEVKQFKESINQLVPTAYTHNNVKTKYLVTSLKVKIYLF